MVKLKLKLLYIIISFLIFKPLLAEESWYQTAANLHKEWAKTYHKVSDLERYTNIHNYLSFNSIASSFSSVLAIAI